MNPNLSTPAPAPKLTIGMVTYDDFDGVYFTIQSIRLYHPEILPEIEFLIIDNNPAGKHAEAVKKFTNSVKDPIRYIPFSRYKSTAVRNRLFWAARTEYVLCTDCHVQFAPGALRRLIDYFDAGEDKGNLLQGPLLYDDLRNVSTHFDLIWRGHMWGVWGCNPAGKDPNAPPFEIPAQGLGAFACRKGAWLGFSPHFRGFGGEEGYIHEKFRKHGKKTICLPFLRWLHRFPRPAGVPYPITTPDRVRNYLIGHLELGMDCAPVFKHFADLGEERLDRLYADAWATVGRDPDERPEILLEGGGPV